ncbi:unnamed protein product [Bursaphelenchus xylophilus]|uniref:DNA-directed DNA polymerase n=1 Tax=Bursaphelenchus xylophilus TaxID=6326 RepID=A0A1I7SVR1_BURXY|nr:unnamed protein product [Bursaphelenchus xylophilus]CAG9098120.1 unnamed protein product [Bursaphelenchus xylophilus]
MVKCDSEHEMLRRALSLSSRRYAPMVPHQTPTSFKPSDLISQSIKIVPNPVNRYLFGPLNTAGPPGLDPIFSKLQLPPLNGTVLEHFKHIGQELFGPFETLLEKAANLKIPKKPKTWEYKIGWTKYLEDGRTVAVDAPDADLLFFDVEVCVKEGHLPTLAVAVSETHWYSWCSGRLVEDTPVPERCSLQHLIPLEDGSPDPKLVIGHNVGYDRARVREQYPLKESNVKFWDTMSMNTIIQGMADHQRLLYEKKDVEDVLYQIPWLQYWKRRVCRNSLEDVYGKFYPEKSGSLDKTYQSVFVTEPIEVIRANFQILIDYCAGDVQACIDVYKKLYPMFKERFPSPITSLGMIIVADAYLPVTSNWRKFFEKCENDADKMNNTSVKAVVTSARALVEELENENKFEQDPWLWVSDWQCKYKTIARPAWYVNLFNKKSLVDSNVDELHSDHVKLKSSDVPRIFGLCYGPYPIFHKRDYGWGFLVPAAEEVPDVVEVPLQRRETVKFPARRIFDLIEKNKKKEFPDVMVPLRPDSSFAGFNFYRLPHPKGEGQNVGNPFNKEYINCFFKEGILRPTRFEAECREFIDAGSVTRFWGNYRERYNEQVTCWLDDDCNVGAIAPAIVPSGTITRRAVHKLWLTSANAKEGMLGSDLKSMVQCSPGWNLVGADVDSQEQWLAALFGDFLEGKQKAGSTAFSNMQLAGTKSTGTDLHTVVAESVGISRNNAKVLNYARLYGSGMNHAIDFLVQKGISREVAKETAMKLFDTTKGTSGRYRELQPHLIPYFEHFIQQICPKDFANTHLVLGKRYFLTIGNPTDRIQSTIFEDWLRHNMSAELEVQGIELDGRHFLNTVYVNYPTSYTLFKDGFESATFNFLEIQAQNPEPRTPILECRLTQALEPLPQSVMGHDDFQMKYKRTSINWVVQSSAVDFLHLLLVCMKWLCQEYDIRARFVISIHDEIRFLVHEEDKYRCALALSLCNLLVRGAIMEKLNIKELPASIAFFSQVDIDTVLRKEVDTVCILPDGTEVEAGEGLTIEQIIEKTNGSLKK